MIAKFDNFKYLRFNDFWYVDMRDWKDVSIPKNSPKKTTKKPSRKTTPTTPTKPKPKPVVTKPTWRPKKELLPTMRAPRLPGVPSLSTDASKLINIPLFLPPLGSLSTVRNVQEGLREWELKIKLNREYNRQSLAFDYHFSNDQLDKMSDAELEHTLWERLQRDKAAKEYWQLHLTFLGPDQYKTDEQRALGEEQAQRMLEASKNLEYANQADELFDIYGLSMLGSVNSLNKAKYSAILNDKEGYKLYRNEAAIRGLQGGIEVATAIPGLTPFIASIAGGYAGGYVGRKVDEALGGDGDTGKTTGEIIGGIAGAGIPAALRKLFSNTTKNASNAVRLASSEMRNFGDGLANSFNKNNFEPEYNPYTYTNSTDNAVSYLSVTSTNPEIKYSTSSGNTTVPVGGNTTPTGGNTATTLDDGTVLAEAVRITPDPDARLIPEWGGGDIYPVHDYDYVNFIKETGTRDYPKIKFANDADAPTSLVTPYTKSTELIDELYNKFTIPLAKRWGINVGKPEFDNIYYFRPVPLQYMEGNTPFTVYPYPDPTKRIPAGFFRIGETNDVYIRSGAPQDYEWSVLTHEGLSHPTDKYIDMTHVGNIYLNNVDFISNLAKHYNVTTRSAFDKWYELRATGNQAKLYYKNILLDQNGNVIKLSRFRELVPDDLLMADVGRLNGYGESYYNAYLAASPEEKKEIAERIRISILMPLFGGVLAAPYLYNQYQTTPQYKKGSKIKLVKRMKL